MFSFNSLDYIFLIFSILILLGFITYEYLKSKNRNLISIFLTGSILFLVAFQIVWIENQFLLNSNGVVQHLHKFISIEGARTANFYFFVSMITYLLGSWTSSFLKYQAKTIKRKDNYVLTFSKFFYFFMFIIVISFIFSLINLGGGIEKSLSTVGTNMKRGVTMHLMFISLGKFPLFYKIINNLKINLVDILLFSFVIFATIFNSRMNTALILLQFFLLWNYKIKEFTRKQLLLPPLIMFMVLIIWGLYREVLNYNLGYSLKDLEHYFYSKDILNWFYHFNIEGFTGLAGLLTNENHAGHLNYHYGLYYLKSLFILIPGQIRHSLELPFNDILMYLESTYPYPNGSIVRSGFEDTYAGFGISGILWFTFFLGFICNYIHKKNISNKKNTILMLISVYLLVLVRGNVNVAIFMVLSEIILFFLFFLFLSIFGIKKIRQSGIKL